MIAITEKSRVAVVALTELAQRVEGPVPIQEVAESRDVPLHVLEQLFSALRRAGVLQSQRGVKGGYSFRRAPQEVTLLEVVEVVDGRLEDHDSDRVTAADAVWQQARTVLAQVLSESTIADMVEREARASDAPMFHI